MFPSALAIVILIYNRAAQLALRPSGSQPPGGSQRQGPSKSELERERFLATNMYSNRARIESSQTSYSIAPQSNFDPTRGLDPASRPIGAGGIEAFRKMTAKQGKKRT
jgi:transcription factor SPN1